MARTIFFAAGDSYRADRPAETLLRTALEGPESAFIAHADVFNSALQHSRPGQSRRQGQGAGAYYLGAYPHVPDAVAAGQYS